MPWLPGEHFASQPKRIVLCSGSGRQGDCSDDRGTTCAPIALSARAEELTDVRGGRRRFSLRLIITVVRPMNNEPDQARADDNRSDQGRLGAVRQGPIDIAG
jgi:hypothetical protein